MVLILSFRLRKERHQTRVGSGGVCPSRPPRPNQPPPVTKTSCPTQRLDRLGRCHITSEVTIRSIRVDDRKRWEPLWHGYLDFYRAVLTPGVTERTCAALCDPTSAVHGLVAEQEDHLAGLAHLVLHPNTWATHLPCYLEDLCVAKPWRGGDVAHRLIAAVYAFADGFGPASVIGLPRSTTPRHAPCTTPSPVGHRSSYTSAEFAGRFRAVRPTPAAARGRSAAQRRGRDRGVRRLPELHLIHAAARVSTRQSRRCSPTKINKEVITKQIQNGRGEGEQLSPRGTRRSRLGVG
jgi:GNAT superfamily N-acetyltransferase